jgi:para-aminobenzoate synthetase component 1
MPAVRAPSARFDGLQATDLCDVVDLVRDPDALDRSGWWAVVGTFEGAITGYRFARVQPALPHLADSWVGPRAPDWQTSTGEDEYRAGVAAIRAHIAAGDVYQVNLCRMLSAPLTVDADPFALALRLAGGNPAPYEGLLDLGDDWIVTASPELFLARDGDVLHSAPIKGTAPDRDHFADKDFPENIMITDLVRNDLGRIARPGSVVVTELLARQEHPGLAHLVSTVRAEIAPGHGWGDVLAATFPPGSVSGAPKLRALQVISELEAEPRGPYCGTIGYVDADRRRARLAVGIRTFFTGSAQDGTRRLHFGTGAGITWPSDPAAEWAETELKAARLVRLAST